MKHEIQDAAYRLTGRAPVIPALQIRSGGCGFFGDVARALNGIRFAQENGFGAHVTWGNRSLYFEAERGTNAWLYYFEESEFDFAGHDQRKTRFSLPYWPSSHDFRPYTGMGHRESLHQAIQTFCAARPEISAAVSGYIEKNFGPSQTLGVHVRMTDAAAGFENRDSVELFQFVSEVDAWLRRRRSADVFLATDDATVVSLFRSEFGDRVHSRDHIRSQTGDSVHGSHDGGTSGSPYRKGAEVLVDALILARCDHLIRTHSRVTWFSLCANPCLTHLDLGVKYLDDIRFPWLADGGT